MTRRHKNRKRALCCAGLLFPCTVASGSSFPQAIVKPARRVVNYSIGNRKIPSHIARKLHGQTESSFENNKDEVVKVDKNNERHMTDYNQRTMKLEGDTLLHTLADASIEADHVDKVFAELRRQYSTASSLQDDQEYDESNSLLRKHNIEASYPCRLRKSCSSVLFEMECVWLKL